MAGEGRLWWVDAYLDALYTAELDGRGVRSLLGGDNRVAHPFAVGVLKGKVYWDDWNTRAIYFTDAKTALTEGGGGKNGSENVFIVTGNQSRLMDLKVSGWELRYGKESEGMIGGFFKEWELRFYWLQLCSFQFRCTVVEFKKADQTVVEIRRALTSVWPCLGEWEPPVLVRMG
jgi:hypothetical protein